MKPKQTPKLPESHTSPENPAHEKGPFHEPTFFKSSSEEKIKSHKKELKQALLNSHNGGGGGPSEEFESQLENVQIATVESIADHAITFISGKHTYTINTDLLPVEMTTKLKPGDLFPLSKDGTVDEVWTGIFELYNQGIEPYLTVPAADDKEFVVNEGFVSHTSKNNPVIWSNKRFNMVEAKHFEDAYIPKIGQVVLFSFGKGKHIPEFTIFSKNVDSSPTLLTKRGNPVVVDAINQHRKAFQKIAQQAKSKNAQPQEKETAQHHSPAQGLEGNDTKHFKNKELSKKSQHIAMTLAHDARAKNEKIDAFTYAHLPETQLEDLKIGTKVVSQNGTPGRIDQLPTTDKNLKKNTVTVAYYRVNKHGKKIYDKAIVKIDEIKMVGTHQKHHNHSKEHHNHKKHKKI